jgi:hypothetical protein
METVPEWVTSYLEMWRRKLYLFEWEITTFISPHPDNDPEGVRAIVTLYPAILQANIVFKDDIPAMLEDVEPGEIRGWKKTIIHELVHIRLADITEYVQGDIFSELSPGAWLRKTLPGKSNQPLRF